MGDYSHGSYAPASVPTDDANLTTVYDAGALAAVASLDGSRVSEQAGSGDVPLHEFKIDAGAHDEVYARWVGQSSVSCVAIPVGMQIYNRSGTPAWEDLGGTAIDSTTGANTNIDLSFTKTGLTNYKAETTNEVAFRIIQKSAAVTTSYANTGGTGDRTAIITVTTIGNLIGGGTASNLVDGAFDWDTTDAVYFNGLAVETSTCSITFAFGSAVVIDEAKWYASSSGSCGLWKWQKSSNGSEFTDLLAGDTFDLAVTGAPDTPLTMTTMAGNTTAYQWYRMQGVSGNLNDGFYQLEIEFKIAGL